MIEMKIVRDMTLEATYKTIKDSLEWAGGSNDSAYAMYVDGILSMAETLLNMLTEPEKDTGPDF